MATPQKASRSKNELTSEVCTLLLKSNVDSLSGEQYLSGDEELIVKQYVGFLSAVAAHTTRLSKDMVSASAIEIFGCNKSAGYKFGAAMKSALAYRNTKGSKGTSGAKLSDSVRAVLCGSKSNNGTLRALQRKMKSPSDKSPSDVVPNDTIDLEASPSAGSSTDACPMSIRDVLAIYGVGDAESKRLKCELQKRDPGEIEISSSQEEVVDCEAARNSEAPSIVL